MLKFMLTIGFALFLALQATGALQVGASSLGVHFDLIEQVSHLLFG